MKVTTWATSFRQGAILEGQHGEGAADVAGKALDTQLEIGPLTTLRSFQDNYRAGMPIVLHEGGREDADKLQGFTCAILWLEEVAPAAGLATGIPAEVLALGSAEGFLLWVRTMALPGPLLSQIAPLLAVISTPSSRTATRPSSGSRPTMSGPSACGPSPASAR